MKIAIDGMNSKLVAQGKRL